MVTLRHVPKVTQMRSRGAHIGPRSVSSIAVSCTLSTTLPHILCEESGFVLATRVMFIHRMIKLMIIIPAYVLFNSMTLMESFGKFWLFSVNLSIFFHSPSHSHTFILSLSHFTLTHSHSHTSCLFIMS